MKITIKSAISQFQVPEEDLSFPVKLIELINFTTTNINKKVLVTNPKLNGLT